MRKFVIAAMIAACIALCTAVWPHDNAIEETPVPAAETAVNAKEATVAEIETEENSASLAEMENEVLRQEASQEERPESETESIDMAMDSDGDLMIRMGDHMAMDMDTGDIHMISSWPDDDE